MELKYEKNEIGKKDTTKGKRCGYSLVLEGVNKRHSSWAPIWDRKKEEDLEMKYNLQLHDLDCESKWRMRNCGKNVNGSTPVVRRLIKTDRRLIFLSRFRGMNDRNIYRIFEIIV